MAGHASRTGAGIGIGRIRASSGSQRCSCSTRSAPSLTARQPDDKFVAEAEDRVVPSERQRRQRKVGEIGMLLGEQRPDEIVRDVDLGGGHVLRRHGISPFETGTSVW